VPSSDPIQRFSDIVENIERIDRFTAGMNRQAFAAAKQTILAAKYALLTISEAATKLGDIANQLCPEIPWRKSGVSGIGFGTITGTSMWSVFGC
jgi:uncharacterized protein with HEPN domain